MALPETGPNVRVDTGIAKGQSVTAAFDPMLAKLVVHGNDRAAACTRGYDALGSPCSVRLRNQYCLPASPHRRSGFRRGRASIPVFWMSIPALAADPPISAELATKLIAAASLSLRPVRDAADAVPELFSAMGAWRN